MFFSLQAYIVVWWNENIYTVAMERHIDAVFNILPWVQLTCQHDVFSNLWSINCISVLYQVKHFASAATPLKMCTTCFNFNKDLANNVLGRCLVLPAGMILLNFLGRYVNLYICPILVYWSNRPPLSLFANIHLENFLGYQSLTTAYTPLKQI